MQTYIAREIPQLFFNILTDAVDYSFSNFITRTCSIAGFNGHCW